MKSINLITRLLLLSIISLMSLTLDAETTIKGPVFDDYGAVYKIKDLNVPLVKSFKYKVLFDISKTSESEDQINRNIESIARFINMHVMHGVKLKNIDIAVVLHSRATRDGLNHKAYEERYLVKNPTLDLIDKLHAKGVKFYQCGQSAYYQNVKTKDLNKNVGMALSALTMLTELQADGYQLIPWY